MKHLIIVAYPVLTSFTMGLARAYAGELEHPMTPAVTTGWSKPDQMKAGLLIRRTTLLEIPLERLDHLVH